MSHGTIKCCECHKIISRCRCPKHNFIKMALCDDCRNLMLVKSKDSITVQAEPSEYKLSDVYVVAYKYGTGYPGDPVRISSRGTIYTTQALANNNCTSANEREKNSYYKNNYFVISLEEYLMEISRLIK